MKYEGRFLRKRLFIPFLEKKRFNCRLFFTSLGSGEEEKKSG